MKKNRFSPQRVFEYGWLIATILGATVSVIVTIRSGFRDNIMLYIVTIFAAILYFVRRKAGKS
ncbi:MAG: hypothetical protein ACOCW8_00530 [bacterium]